jgi:hypothetical protein
MPEWLRWTCFFACLPLMGLFCFAELEYLREGSVYLGCFCIFLQCTVGIGMIVMIFKWWPPKK